MNMKKSYKVLSVFASIIFSTASFGSSLVCSGEQLYSSSTRKDSGIMPQPGTPIGKNIIVHDGKVLLDYTFVQGLGQFGFPPYRLDLVGESKVLEETGNSIHGSKVFTQMAVLLKVDSIDPSKIEEIFSQAVVCRQVWAMVP